MGKQNNGSFPRAKTLLVFSPHPDDLELSAGLLCHKAALLGWNIVEIVITNGARGGIDPTIFHSKKLIQTRINEVHLGASILGVNHVQFWDYEDALLDEKEVALKRRVKNTLLKFNPTLIVFPSTEDTHPDHSCTHRVVSTCISVLPIQVLQLQYCFWGKSLSQNICIVHEDGITKKISAIKAHKSQPIDSYLSRKKNKDLLTLGKETFFCPDLDQSITALRIFGFNVSPQL